MQRHKRLPLLFRKFLHPRIGIVEADVCMRIALQPPDGDALFGDHYVRNIRIAYGVCWLQPAVFVEENRDARHVQCLGDAFHYRLQQRPHFYHRPHLHRELTEDLFCVVRLAEETAVHPAAKAISKSAADRYDCRQSRDHDRDA